MFRRSFMGLGMAALAMAFAGGAAASVITPPQMVRGLPSVAQRPFPITPLA